MRIFPAFCGALLIGLGATNVSHGQENWLQWRGPTSDNHAPQNTKLPLRWDLETGENILWKTPLPGRGHSTPIFVGSSIYLTTMDKGAGVQAVIRLDRASGKIINTWAVHRNLGRIPMHPNNSGASPTLACDGQQLYASFYGEDSIRVTALTLEGQLVWQKRVCDFDPERFQFGYGASPIIEGDLLLIAAEYDGADSGLYALDRRTGEQRWKVPRPENLNFASPIVATIAGERSIFLAGASTMAAYDPQSGNERWNVTTATDAICGTVVWDDRRLMISGGNPGSGTWCVDGASSRKEIWSNTVKCYEQSLLAFGGYVLGVSDSGVAYCWRTMDGTEMWKKRLFANGISASPTLVGDEIVIASENGEVFTIAANPDRFELLAKNRVGFSIFATPVAIDDRLYVRSGIYEDGEADELRREFLIAIGESR